jgi:putative drug exporter of the RND superfamily
MSSLCRWVLSHKRIVVVSWIVLTLAGIAAVGPASSALRSDPTVPHKEGWTTNATIAYLYGSDPDGTAPLIPVVTLPRGETVETAGVHAELERVDARLRAALPTARIASYVSTGDKTFLSRDGRTIFSLVFPPPDPNSDFGENPIGARAASRALRDAEVGGRPVRLTGMDALSADDGGSGGTGLLLEALIGGAGALLVLAFVFGSLLAFVPILMAVVSIMTSFLVLLGLTQLTSVSPIVEFVVALVGLGVAIDYSLLLVSRWREERSLGRSGDEAVQRAMETAGRAVVFSGLTVAIGLLALIALPIPDLRSLGYGGVLIPLLSTLVAITLLPVLLATLGPRLDWPHRRTDEKPSRGWIRWAQAVSRRRWIAAVSGVAVVLALAYAATGLRMGDDVSGSALARSGDAAQGLRALQQAGIGEGALLPHEVLVGGSTSPLRVAAALRRVPGVHGAVAPTGAAWRSGGTALVEVVPTADSGSAAGSATLERVRRAAHATGHDVRVGGQPAENADFVAAVYGSFPLIIAVIAIATFVLLARALRSLLLPVKAIVLNLLSIAATWGVLVLVWQHGYGSEAIWGIHATGSIPSWMPLMVFAFLFGLSMDYEVFILSRIREEYDRDGSTREAVVRGIGRTGRLVTCAALILFLAFTSMASAPDTDTKIAATGLAAGILLDATVIRALIVPAVVSLMGRWNWWLPAWPARLLRVEPSLAPAAPAGRSGGTSARG